ncbi:hypothetical protein LCGC14_2935630 [marine sediment metagenome]|uniref:Uncharacterized protein n=1 Tax=marine sediment metagenome TaxID=412755 RepID=A0A0F9AAM3_9ZZZZ
MEVMFRNNYNEVLCFNHAIEAVLHNNQHITAFTDDSECDQSWVGYVCSECTKDEEKEDE